MQTIRKHNITQHVNNTVHSEVSVMLVVIQYHVLVYIMTISVTIVDFSFYFQSPLTAIDHSAIPLLIRTTVQQ